jgi:iron complex transport system ATP-binding protein
LAPARFPELSGGERQMILIARTLAQGASVLIMDELTADLDYSN